MPSQNSSLEICIGMICGSLPCIKPLYTRLRHGNKSIGLSADSSLGRRSSAYQLSNRKRFASSDESSSKPAAIYRSHNIEYSSGPAIVPRTESEDSILPRNMTAYGGHVETLVRGPSASNDHGMVEQGGRPWNG